MKFKKVLLIISIVILTTSCSANYELEFKNNVLKEVTTISQDKNSLTENERLIFDEYSKYYIPSIVPTNNIGEEKDLMKKEDGQKYYRGKYVNNNELVKLTYKYRFTKSNFDKSFIPSYSIEYFNFLTDDDKYTISTSVNLPVFEQFSFLDEINVHIKSNHKLLDTNADRVDGYNYYWTLKRDNDKYIYLELSKDEKIFNYENEVVNTVIYVTGAVIFVVVIVIYHYKKLKR